jgi:hypothetical protein
MTSKWKHAPKHEGIRDGFENHHHAVHHPVRQPLCVIVSRVGLDGFVGRVTGLVRVGLEGGGSGFGSGRRSWPNAGKRENEEMKSVCTRRECGVRKFVGSLARAGRESRGGGGLTRGTGNPGKRCRRGRWRKASCARVVVTDVPRVVLCGTRVERRSGRSVVSVKTTNPFGAQNTGTP